jgi:hypothetical protein
VRDGARVDGRGAEGGDDGEVERVKEKRLPTTLHDVFVRRQRLLIREANFRRGLVGLPPVRVEHTGDEALDVGSVLASLTILGVGGEGYAKPGWVELDITAARELITEGKLYGVMFEIADTYLDYGICKIDSPESTNKPEVAVSYGVRETPTATPRPSPNATSRTGTSTPSPSATFAAATSAPSATVPDRWWVLLPLLLRSRESG